MMAGQTKIVSGLEQPDAALVPAGARRWRPICDSWSIWNRGATVVCFAPGIISTW